VDQLPLAPVPRDRFGLRDAEMNRGLRLEVGSVDVSRAYRSLSIKSANNSLAVADFALDTSDPSVALLDFTGTVIISRAYGAHSQRLFTGTVLTADSKGELLHLSCMSLPEMNDRAVGGLAHWNAPAIDLIYLLVRTAGVSDDKTMIHGLEDLPYEMFEVAVPVSGVEVGNPVTIGEVTFVSASLGSQMAERFDADFEVTRQFIDASAYAVAYVGDKTMFRAERSAVHAIDTALAWLLVRSRYSSARLPTGPAENWRRDLTLTSPKRADLMVVRGLATQRQWIRRVDEPIRGGVLHLDSQDRGLVRPALVDRISPTKRQALLAAARAVAAADAITAITAIWESIEHYVGGKEANQLFNKRELKALRKAIPAEFSGRKRARIEDLIGQLNAAPLLARLRARLAEDSVPITDSEIDLLVQLRKVRNDVVHGRVATPPDDSVVKYGVAIVARMLVASMDGAMGMPGSSRESR
jgi:hypothetical protein